MALTEEQIASYHRDGFLVIENWWDGKLVSDIRGRIGDIVDSAELSQVRSVFSTKDQTRKSDDYFLTSAREIRFFWEEKAWDAENERLTMPPCIGISLYSTLVYTATHPSHPSPPLLIYHSYKQGWSWTARSGSLVRGCILRKEDWEYLSGLGYAKATSRSVDVHIQTSTNWR